MEIRQPKRSSRGCYRPYDPNQMTSALNAVYADRMSIRLASQKFGIPKSTLEDRLTGKVGIDVIKSGTAPMFSQEQEALLKNHLITMAEVGYGYSRRETMNLATNYAVHLGHRDRQHPLSTKWLYNFIGRFPELKVKKPRSLEVARARSATRSAIDSYFSELDKIITKYSLLDRPNMIYNIDEKGLSLEHKPPKIVAGKFYKAQAITSGRSKNVTIIGCVSGVGQQIPPYFIFPGARMTGDLMSGASPGAEGTVTDSGWSNTEVFESYMKNHLLKHLPARTSSLPALVLYDGHKSHVSLSLIEWAKAENIILFVLPPHCSHLLQPLDVSCFGPFEISWNAACHHYIRESGGKMVTRNEACSLACKVYASTLTVPNIQAAFRRSGIVPFSPDVIKDHQLAPSLTFAKPQPQVPNEKTIESAATFLEEKGGNILENVMLAKKPRNTLSKVVSGKAITEDDIVSKIRDHQQKYQPKKKMIKPTTQKTVKKSKKCNPTPSTSKEALSEPPAKNKRNN